MFRIIAVEREYGCGGGTIARKLADRLGWKLWDQLLTEEIGSRAHVDCSTVERLGEKLDSRFYRLAKIFWRGSYERSIPVDDSRFFDADCMVSMMESITAKIASQGDAVVVGRGAPYFFREREDTFRVFFYAPAEEKIRRLCELGESAESAQELVENVDRERVAFCKHYFSADWPTRALYHVMINTAMGDEQAIATVLDAMRRLDQNTALKTSGIRGVL